MVTRSGIKVCGQDQGIGHGVKSREGSRLGVQVGGQCLDRGHCLGVKVGVKVVVKVSGSRSGVKVRVMISGHKVGSTSGVKVRGQGQGSRSGVKVRGVVKVRVRGSSSGGLGSDGMWGRVEINILFLSRTHDRIEFHSIPFHSIPFQSIPFHSNPFHSIITQCQLKVIIYAQYLYKMKTYHTFKILYTKRHLK